MTVSEWHPIGADSAVGAHCSCLAPRVWSRRIACEQGEDMHYHCLYCGRTWYHEGLDCPASAYPSLQMVEDAGQVQLGRWIRRLPSPGEYAAGQPDFMEALRREAKVMDRIIARFQAMGGWTPAISKAVG